MTGAGDRQREARVPLARVWERTSKQGRRYWAGRLGSARLLLFEIERKNDDDPALELVLVPAEPRDRPSAADALAEQRQPPSAAREAVLDRVAHARSAWRQREGGDGNNPFD